MSTIPADRTLMLGSILTESKMLQLQKLANAQKPQEAAQERLDATILMVRNLEAIVNEMINMKIPDDQLQQIQDKLIDSKKAMIDAAIGLGTTTVAAQEKIKTIRDELNQDENDESNETLMPVESPVDFFKTKVTIMPALANDAMKMDIQFFANESTRQTSSGAQTTEKHANTISSYINSIFSSWTGSPREAANLSKTTHAAVTQQSTNHDVESTLVICANCTHKGGTLLAPLVLDPEKAMRAWNDSFPNDTLATDATTISQVARKSISKRLQAKIDKLKEQQQKPDDTADTTPADTTTAPSNDTSGGKGNSKNALRLLTGATQGSSFVGFVHTLRSKTENEIDYEQQEENKASVKDHIKNLLFVNSIAGKFGLSQEEIDKAKGILSTLNVSTHCSIVTEGLIPNLSSGHVEKYASEVLKPNPQEIQQTVKDINATAGGDGSDDTSASSRTGVQIMELQRLQTQNAIEALGNWDKMQNQTLDMNTLFSAFSDYVRKAESGAAGRPIEYFFKALSKEEVAQVYWQARYSPDALDNERDDDDEEAAAKKKKEGDSKVMDNLFADFTSPAGGDSTQPGVTSPTGGGSTQLMSEEANQAIDNLFEEFNGEIDGAKRREKFEQLKKALLQTRITEQALPLNADIDIEPAMSGDSGNQSLPGLALSSGSGSSEEETTPKRS